MTDEPFMDVALQALLFLESSDEHVVDEDAAIEMMEQIAATLGRLEPTARQRFLRHIQRRAANATTDDKRRAIASVAASLGLTLE